jgi:D-sedoheptulose 7-phosphate isomerase
VSENLQTGFRFISLNDNMPYLLAIANDYDYSQVFKLQLQNHLQAGDLVIGISGSGNSANVLSALDYANSRGAMTAALVGFDGGQAKDIAQLTVIVPVYDMQTVEDIHLTLNHLMMKIIKKYLEGQQIDHKPDSSAG